MTFPPLTTRPLPYLFAGLIALVLLIWAASTCHSPTPPVYPPPVIDSIRVQPGSGRLRDEAVIDSIARLQRP